MSHIEKIKEEYAKGKGYREARLLEQDAFAGQHINSLMQRAFNAALELAEENNMKKILEYEKLAEKNKDSEHNFKKFTYKSAGYIEASKALRSLKINS